MSDQTPKHGHFCWNELVTNDTKAAGDFYTKLLGWSANKQDMGDFTYTIFKAGDNEVGGMMAIGKDWGDVPPHWMAYVVVDDVDVSTRKAEELGAKVCMPTTDIPKVGRFSVITDPTGATISLFKSAKQ
ncbi:MAG: VOC family protein [Candidatus Zixiibacteriota bacterium]|nr:MAG: VOC family protein [candidate division Zixibacteria bacterium]